MPNGVVPLGPKCTCTRYPIYHRHQRTIIDGPLDLLGVPAREPELVGSWTEKNDQCPRHGRVRVKTAVWCNKAAW